MMIDRHFPATQIINQDSQNKNITVPQTLKTAVIVEFAAAAIFLIGLIAIDPPQILIDTLRYNIG